MKTRTTARGTQEMTFASNLPSTATSRYYQQQNSVFQQPKKVEEIKIKTIVKHENNSEIFLTDAPEVDFDKLNEECTQEMREKYELSD